MSFTRKFFTADTHFGHSAVIGHCQRPFADAYEMDESMIASWNEVVGDGDIVYHLGDFAMGLGDEARVREIFARLRGRKRLVLGNHDVDRKGDVHPTIAGLAWDARPEHAMETKDGGKRIYLHHYACRVWPAAHHGSFHFYGHSHGKLPTMGRSRDVGVDVADVMFQPRTFTELTGGMA